jgi:hypothetical protein
MQTNDILNLVGLSLNFIGSIILGISLSRYLTSIHGAAAIHDMQIKSLISRDNKILSADVGALLKAGVEDNRAKTTIGLVITIAGFGIQLIPYFLNFLQKK